MTEYLEIDAAAAYIKASPAWLYPRARDFGGVKAARWLFTHAGLDAGVKALAEKESRVTPAARTGRRGLVLASRHRAASP